MKKINFFLFVLSLLIVAVAVPVGAQELETRYVVVFDTVEIPASAPEIIAEAGGTIAKTFPEVGIAIVTSTDPDFADHMNAFDMVLATDEELSWILPSTEAFEFEATEPDPAVDVYYDAYQWDIRRVYADAAWPITSGSHDTVVAVIDTGIAWNHPDLAPNVLYATCFSTQPTCSDYPDLHWHGTHVAGTIAAAFGGGGAVGVGPNLGLASYNVFELVYDPDSGGYVVSAYDEAIWAAMLDVAAQGFDVINMSLGSYAVMPEDGPAEKVAWNRVADYVTKQGVTIVASSGNGAADLNGALMHIPSDVTGITSVGATGIWPDPVYPQDDAIDVLAFYSNYGASVSLVAPGGDLGPDGTVLPYLHLVFSTYVVPDPVCAETASCPIGYAWAGGTSMASPHVAGVAGLVSDANPDLTASQVAKILKQTAESLGDRQLFGHGMVDALAAVEKADK